MINEKQLFKNLLSKDPDIGTKNRIIRIDKIYLVPGWVFDSNNDYVEVKYKTLNRRIKREGYNTQILYDILVLGLTKFEDRPRCPICGDLCKFKNFSKGYLKTCNKEKCIKESIKNTVKNLWDDENYRSIQSKSHIEWASKEENKQIMREASLKLWSNPEYRETQINSHKKFAQNNPDRIRNGTFGLQPCSKSDKDKLLYDSSWEQLFIILCDNLDIVLSINRVGFGIKYKYLEEDYLYFPDFDITLSNGKRLMIELKANWMISFDKKTPFKLKAGEDYVRSSDIFDYYLVLTEDQLFIDKKSATKFDNIGVENILNNYNSIL